jgi:hypothetical protein
VGYENLDLCFGLPEVRVGTLNRFEATLDFLEFGLPSNARALRHKVSEVREEVSGGLLLGIEQALQVFGESLPAVDCGEAIGDFTAHIGVSPLYSICGKGPQRYRRVCIECASGNKEGILRSRAQSGRFQGRERQNSLRL